MAHLLRSEDNLWMSVLFPLSESLGLNSPSDLVTNALTHEATLPAPNETCDTQDPWGVLERMGPGVCSHSFPGTLGVVTGLSF